MAKTITKERIIFNIPKNVKDEFKQTCDVLGLNMTNQIITMILDFNEKAKQKPKNK